MNTPHAGQYFTMSAGNDVHVAMSERYCRGDDRWQKKIKTPVDNNWYVDYDDGLSHGSSTNKCQPIYLKSNEHGLGLVALEQTLKHTKYAK